MLNCLPTAMLILLIPETEDIPLKERVRHANAICAVEGPTNALCPPHPLSRRPHRKLLMGNKQNLANLLSQEESDEKAGVVLQVISPLVRV